MLVFNYGHIIPKMKISYRFSADDIIYYAEVERIRTKEVSGTL